MADDLCPAIDVRQPADRAPRDKHHVEGCHVRDRGRRIIEVRLHEARPFGKPQLIGKLPRGVDSGCREVQSDNRRTALCKLQAVGAEMTLQVQDVAALDRPEFHLFDGAEAATPGSQSREIVAARTEMQGDFLIPMGAVSRFPCWFIHERCSRWEAEASTHLRRPAMAAQQSRAARVDHPTRRFTLAALNTAFCAIPAVRGATIKPLRSTLSGHPWRVGVARNLRVRSTRRMTASIKPRDVPPPQSASKRRRSLRLDGTLAQAPGCCCSRRPIYMLPPCPLAANVHLPAVIGMPQTEGSSSRAR